MDYFVISDIHGMYNEFLELLEYWDNNDKLVILGDMIDRGYDSLSVVNKVMELKELYGEKIIVLRGNHDQMLLDFVDKPLEHGELYQYNGGNSTIYSFTKDKNIFYDSFIQRADKIKKLCHEQIEFLSSLEHYYQEDRLLFTHAGFNSLRSKWEDSTCNELIWIRDHYKNHNNTGLVNVFGHTPTQLLNKDKSDNIYISNCQSYIGVDGACAYGGQLNGLLISGSGVVLDTYKVLNRKEK